MKYEQIIYEKQPPWAQITFNRPSVLNALTNHMVEECLDAARDAVEDNAVCALILTGAGDKAFMSGADIQELQQRTAVTEITYRGRRDLAHLLQHMPKPTIAAVNGYALGGGCELALACTFRIAAENAVFGLPEINLGLIPGNGGTQRLPRLIGLPRAMALILTGDRVGAREAQRIGLVLQVVAAQDLLPEARRLAEKLAQKPPLALRLAKEAVNASLHLGLAEGIEYENKLFALCASTHDKEEGVTAFLEKRTPKFIGR